MIRNYFDQLDAGSPPRTARFWLPVFALGGAGYVVIAILHALAA